MPTRAKKQCSHPGCTQLVSAGSVCAKHKKQEQQQQDQERGTASERGYDHRWRKARAFYLRHHPLCVHCQAEGRVTLATVVDHIVPHKGDQVRFWDQTNWQSLCDPHHRSKSASEDGALGNPIKKR